MADFSPSGVQHNHRPTLIAPKPAALILSGRGEANAALSEPCGNAHRKAGQHAAVGEPQTVDEVPRRAMIIDHRIEVECTARRIDHWRSGDAERDYIAAGQCRASNRIAKRGAPHDAPGCRVQRIHKIAFGRGDDQAAFCAWRAPIERCP